MPHRVARRVRGAWLLGFRVPGLQTPTIRLSRHPSIPSSSSLPPTSMLLKPIAPAPEPLHSADNRVNVAKAENSPSPAFAPARENKDVRPLRSNIPRVVLDMDTISSAMAARLAKSLLCHLLYQKSQVPL